MDALVEGAAGQVASVGAEGHAVDGLLVAGERVDAHAPLHVPQPHRGVEGGAAEVRATPRSGRSPPGGGGGGGGVSSHLASMRLALGLLVPGPVGLHLMV